jgi:PAS domain S-box-containing protein
MDVLKDKDELFRLITENVGDVLWIMDLEQGKFTYVSPSVFKLRGFTPEEVLQQSVLEVMTEESYRFIAENLGVRIGRFFEGDESVRVMTHEIDQLKKDGTIVHTEVVTTLMKDDTGKVTEILGVSRDISERKQAQREIARLNEVLEERIQDRTAQLRNINTELEAFTYSVSHDLRAPLRAINGFSTILEKEYNDILPGEGKRLLRIICDNVRKMDRLITDLLAFSRLSKSEINLLQSDMTRMVKNTWEAMTDERDRNSITFELQSLPDAACDPLLIGQVWSNLISNAIKFTAPVQNRKISVSGKRKNGEIIYEIDDNGVGFNAIYSEKIFEVFQRLHKAEDFDGSGVGLAIVKRIVNRHGGKVWATAKEGSGSSFMFSLPNLQ